jgi:hypothetical protein
MVRSGSKLNAKPAHHATAWEIAAFRPELGGFAAALSRDRGAVKATIRVRGTPAGTFLFV